MRFRSGAIPWISLAVMGIIAAVAQTSRPRPASSPSVVSSFLRWGGGAFTSGHCLMLDATGAAADAGAPCSLPSGNVLFFAGPRTSGHCVQFDEQGRAVSAGAPCGAGGGGPGVNWVFVDFEVPSGSINGSNATFVLAHAPNPASSLKVFWNGLRLRAGGVDYQLTNNNIIVFTAGIPSTGDQLFVEYRYIP
jgi:hypothetical protein